MIDLKLSEGTKAQIVSLCDQRGLTAEELIAFWVRTAKAPSKSKPYGLTDTLRFGRLFGMKVETVIRAEPSYIAWCKENLEHFTLAPDAEKLFKQIQKGAGYVDLPADDHEYREVGPQEMDPAVKVPDRKSVRWHEQNYPPPDLAEIEVTDDPPQSWSRKGVKPGTYKIHRDIGGQLSGRGTWERKRLYVKARKHWVRCGKTLEKAVLNGTD